MLRIQRTPRKLATTDERSERKETRVKNWRGRQPKKEDAIEGRATMNGGRWEDEES
jgi:hypothetical protein